MQADEHRLGERVATLEARYEALEADVRQILRDIHGPPREESLRGRIHILENDTAAAKAAHAALETAQAIREEQNQQTFTKREKVAALFIALVVAVTAIATLVVTVSSHTT